ncbi:MAG: hypothetical protein J7M34_13430 [Anaerolineae bacterium]|nr:hypothetical protein [Anaerolineae bacterium]
MYELAVEGGAAPPSTADFNGAVRPSKETIFYVRRERQEGETTAEVGRTEAAQEPLEAAIPEQCAHCPFLDKEYDPLSETHHLRLYCKVPWWHPKRWTCKLPPGVIRA